MYVSIVVCVIVGDGINDLFRLLRGRSVVQVYELFAVHLPLKDRELASDVIHTCIIQQNSVVLATECITQICDPYSEHYILLRPIHKLFLTLGINLRELFLQTLPEWI